MRSTLNVRICHLLRVMRVVAPVEWNLGLPFPTHGAVPLDEPVTERLDEVSFAAWLESRARARQPETARFIERPLAA